MGSGPQNFLPPPNFRSQLKVQFSPVLLTNWLYIRGSHDLFLEFNYFAKVSQQNAKKHLVYKIPSLLQKDITQEQSDGGDAQGKV